MTESRETRIRRQFDVFPLSSGDVTRKSVAKWAKNLNKKVDNQIGGIFGK